MVEGEYRIDMMKVGDAIEKVVKGYGTEMEEGGDGIEMVGIRY